MRADVIKEYLDRRPFKPFRIIMTEGKPVDVRKPGSRLMGSLLIVARLVRKGVIRDYRLLWLDGMVKIVPIPKRHTRLRKHSG
jgi:hypothetical protein